MYVHYISLTPFEILSLSGLKGDNALVNAICVLLIIVTRLLSRPPSPTGEGGGKEVFIGYYSFVVVVVLCWATGGSGDFNEFLKVVTYFVHINCCLSRGINYSDTTVEVVE